MSTSAALGRTTLFAVAYLAATVAGRLTVVDGTSLSMVWPAAGIAVVWFGAQRHLRTFGADVAALAVLTFGVNMLTGAGTGLAALFVVANLVQVGVFFRLVSWWRPRLWGAGGIDGLRGPRDLWALLGAAFAATVAGAAIGPTGVWLVTGVYQWPVTAVWLVRNTASVLIIGAVGLCVGYAVSTYRARNGGTLAGWPRHALRQLARTSWWRLAEYTGLVVCSIVAYLGTFGMMRGAPIAFVLIGLTVWAAVRLSTPFVVLHDLGMACLVVLLTLNGDGPFAQVESVTERAFVAQLFVAMVAVVGLALALGRDERAALLAALAAEKEQDARRADLMAAIFDSMGDGLSVIDAGGRVVLRNPAAVRLLGGRISPDDQVTDGQFYGLHHLDGTLLGPQELPFARAMAGENAAMDVLIRNPGVPEGRIVHLKVTALPDGHGAHRAVLLFTDVTADRRHREELAGFAGVVAHDLLNPLTTINGWTETTLDALAESPATPVVTEATANLARVTRAAARMRRLIEDLLTYTTTQHAELAPDRVELADLIEDIAAARIDAAVAGGRPAPRFTLGPLHPVHADPRLTRQLLDNLIGNAIKYTDSAVVAHLTIDCAPLTGDLLQVNVRDNGIGIPAGQHEAIFGNFHRAHAGSAYSGTGLGLSICKRIVERHGGTITATDNPGGGSCLTFTLPTGDRHELADRDRRRSVTARQLSGA